MHLRFQRRVRAATVAALAGIVVLAGSVAAEPGYTDPIVLRKTSSATTLNAQDIAAKGRKISVVWAEWQGSGQILRTRTSTDGGDTFRARRLVEDRRGAWAATDICRGYAWVSHTFRKPGDPANFDGVILSGFQLVGDGETGQLLVPSGEQQAGQTDIACVGSRRHVVGWLDTDFSSDATAHFSFVPILPPAKGDPIPEVHRSFAAQPFGDVAVAGSATRGWVAWTDVAGRLRVKRFDVGPGPDFPVTPRPTVTLPDTGQIGTVEMAAQGSKVVIAYERNADTWVRVSTNGGASFGPRTKLLDGVHGGDLFTLPLSADIRGNRVVVHAIEAGGFKDLETIAYRFQSSDTGSTWSSQRRYSDGDRVGALARIGGQTKLVEAWDRWSAISGQQRIRFHRKI